MAIEIMKEIPPELGTMGFEEDEWLAAHPEVLDPYPGKWVAVSGKEIVAVGDSPKEVLEIAKQKTSKIPMVFQVPRPDEGVLIL